MGKRTLLGWIAVLSAADALPTQEPAGQDVLDALRTSIAEQEKSVRVLAWTAESKSMVGKDQQQRRAGELRVRVAYEVKPNGNAHAWFEPETLCGEGRAFTNFGEAVHRGTSNAVLYTNMAEEGGAPTVARGSVGLARNAAYDFIERAGASCTPWPINANRAVRISELLRAARADDVKVKTDEVEVQLPPGRGSSSSYRFRRHDARFTLLEHRETRAGKVTSRRVLEETLVDGRIWFPRRIRIEWHHVDEPLVTEIEVTDVKLDPNLADGTFTIVAPAKTLFQDETTKERFTVSADTPELRGTVKLETEKTPKPEPPTAPTPTKR